jgi:cytidine deaminase
MNTLTDVSAFPLEEIDSDADFILCGESRQLLSEHCTMAEARIAFFQEAARYGLGEHLPKIYRRDEQHWVPLS